MGRIEKDKNFLNIWVDGKAKPYRYDINAGVMYGLKGGVISSVPQGIYKLVCDYRDQSNVIYYLFRLMRCRQTDIMGMDTLRKEKLSLCDRLDSIGCPISHANHSYLDRFAEMISANPKLFGMFAEWIKANPNGYLSDWMKINEKQLWCATYHIEVNQHLTAEMVDWLYDCRCYFPSEWLSAIAYWLPRYLWDFYGKRPDISCIKNLFFFAKELEVSVDHKCDFFRTYINLYREYTLRKQELDNRAIKDMADRHRTALSFETDDYVVVIPETADEIINEGKNQHNCVGGYVADVVKKACNIVFVRKKSEPNTSYITVEINKNGRIQQYLRAYNHSTEGADNDFYRAYQQHLSTHWGE